MLSPGETVWYVCGCTREVDTKAMVFCDSHSDQRDYYAELALARRRSKEAVLRLTRRLKSHIGRHERRRLKEQLEDCQLKLARARRKKYEFWYAFEERTVTAV